MRVDIESKDADAYLKYTQRYWKPGKVVVPAMLAGNVRLPPPLTPEQEADEFELRMEQMNANIARMRANEQKLRNDMRWENRRSMVQFVVAITAALGAGVALATYVNGKLVSSPAVSQIIAPAPQIIYLVPGQPPPPR